MRMYYLFPRLACERLQPDMPPWWVAEIKTKRALVSGISQESLEDAKTVLALKVTDHFRLHVDDFYPETICDADVPQPAASIKVWLDDRHLDDE